MLRNHQKPPTKHKFSTSNVLETSFASTCPVKDICLSVEMSFSPLVCFSTFKFVGLVVAEYSPFLNKSHFLLKLFQSFPSPIFRHIINSHCTSRQSPQYLNIWAQNIWISELTIWISELTIWISEQRKPDVRKKTPLPIWGLHGAAGLWRQTAITIKLKDAAATYASLYSPPNSMGKASQRKSFYGCGWPSPPNMAKLFILDCLQNSTKVKIWT